ncbi:hypothetical protein KAX75_06025 [candidate division WOR-3 bacterium]|nr:hypothetical protein [candidate division WOR-3 bacterium]
MYKKVLLTIFSFLLILLIFTVCTKKPADIDVSNQPPDTYIVNVPPDSSNIYHARLLFWYGTDADGIVTRYDWAIDDTVYNENIAGSGWHSLYMDSTLATQDTIAFEAPFPDTIYTHVFYVRAVDNKDLPDPSPAQRIFNMSNIPPNTRFFSTPKDSSQRFILGESTSTWKGINFAWTAIDSDEVFPPQFQYCWDDTTIDFDPASHKGWSNPIAEESYYFTGENAPLDSGYHILYIRAIDDAGAIDQSLSDTTISILEISVDSTVTPWDTTIIDADTVVYNQWRTIYFVIPEIAKDENYRKVIWINLTNNAYINNNIAIPFFTSILGDSLGITYDSLSYAYPYGNTDHILFGNYSTIIWSKENKDLPPVGRPLTDNEILIEDFLHIGGRIIFTGSETLKTGSYMTGVTFGIQKPFPFTELHIEQYNSTSAGTPTDTSISPVETDTAFYSQESAYPYLSLNSSILWHPIIDFQFIVEVLVPDYWGDYSGDLTSVYTLNHYQDHATYEKQPCVLRFVQEGKTTPSFFYFGFPISFMEYNRGTQLVRLVFQELDEIQ